MEKFRMQNAECRIQNTEYRKNCSEFCVLYSSLLEWCFLVKIGIASKII